MKNKQPLTDFVLVVALLLLLFQDYSGGDTTPTPPSERLIAREGVAVLVVSESIDKATLPREQQLIVGGYKWVDKVPDGNWRVVDPDSPWTGTSDFKAAYDRPRATLPWCVVSGPGKQYEGPLPGTVDEMTMKVEAAAQ